VKIAPHYEGPVIYVPDASRSVGICSDLLSEERGTKFRADLEADYAHVRELHASRKQVPLVTHAAARANRTPIDWAAYTPPAPKFIGRRMFRQYDLAELAACIDWGPFFQTWDLAGGYPRILEDAVVGEAARKVFDEGKAMLRRIVEGRWLTANGVLGFWPANTVDDDTIEVYADEARTQVLLRWSPLRMQTERPVVPGPDGTDIRRPNRSLADFIAPRGTKPDWIGLFAVTAGIGVDKHEAQFEAAHDDYSAIMLKALADRLAEAFAERLHQRVRSELWGYAADEKLSNEDLIAEKYHGIRPAPGYPACPEHGVKFDLFRALQAEEIGMGLTESLAMTPAASVSGFYLAHPDSTYFNVGRIGEDQLRDWAARTGVSEEEARRRLGAAVDTSAGS
jgi:5-methyltetrahydrofolate--homocysteine methyltransferase